MLDPHFKPKWCNEVQNEQVKVMALAEMLSLEHLQGNERDDESCPPPTKVSKLSFTLKLVGMACLP